MFDKKGAVAGSPVCLLLKLPITYDKGYICASTSTYQQIYIYVWNITCRGLGGTVTSWGDDDPDLW